MATFGNMNWRKEKKLERQMGVDNPIYIAYLQGQRAACERNPRNPYPKGRRHDEWQRGYESADPMGDHHGRNY